jgi:predicted O-methyltransferase YrrM
MSARTYSHSGDFGDLLAALATVKTLGGGRLVLYPHECTGYRMTPERAAVLEPLLRAQSYLHAVEWKSAGEGEILDHWRSHYRHRLNLADMVATWCGIPHYPRERPWITVPTVKRVARVVLGRSSRYHNDSFVPVWHRAWQEYHRDAVFVGTPEEHSDFCSAIGPVAYSPTRNLLEVAEVVAGADLCLFNQTGNYWVAEALKVPVVLEACLSCQNCHFERWGLIYGTDAGAPLPTLDQLRERWRINAAKKGEDRTVITEDRLRVIAESVRRTEECPGEMAECGAYRGGSAKVIATVCPQKKLHVFDTFAGLPADEVLAGCHKAGDFTADRREVDEFLGGSNVEIHQGFFPDTARGLEDRTFSFVHLDMDLYESTRAALEFFWPRIAPGGVIVLDDVDWKCTPGVNRALDECGLMALVERTNPQQGQLRRP